MPEGVSAMRGLALPAQPLSDTPFVVTAPNAATSTKSPYSRPAANVPDATVTGFFISNPPRFTRMFTEVGTGRRGHPSTKRVPQRIEQSCYELSTTDDSITEIAYRNGFNDLSYFIRTFLKNIRESLRENIKDLKLLCCKYKGAPKRSFSIHLFFL